MAFCTAAADYRNAADVQDMHDFGRRRDGPGVDGSFTILIPPSSGHAPLCFGEGLVAIIRQPEGACGVGEGEEIEDIAHQRVRNQNESLGREARI